MLLPLGIILLGIITIPFAFAETYEEHIIEPVATFGYSGCQDKDGCYNPVTTHAELGDVIIFNNTDFVAHTFTSGTPDGGPDGIFDSGLKLPRYSFQWQADIADEIPFFCILHPWMTGLIIVEGDQPETGIPEPEIPSMPEADQKDLHTIIDQLVELVDDLKEQMASLEDRMSTFEDRLAALEAGDSEPEQSTEPEAAFVEGYVYFDSNRNGVFDDNDLGLADMTLTISGTFTGNLVAIVQTESDGFYNLIFHPDDPLLSVPGSYRIDVAGIDLSGSFTVLEGQTIRFDLRSDTIPETPETPESTEPVFITTDKTAYSLGDTIKVTGFIDPSILDAQYLEERFVVPETRYNVYSVIIGAGMDDQRPYNFDPHLECSRADKYWKEQIPNIDLGAFYLWSYFRFPDQVDDKKCFDEFGNFNFDVFEVTEYSRIGDYKARLIVKQTEGDDITEYSQPFTIIPAS